MKPIKYIIISVLCCIINYASIRSQDAEHILEANKSALVSVYAFEEAWYNENSNMYAFDTLVLWGSGFIFSNDGKIGTCYHVISQNDSIIIKTSDSTFYPGKVISVDTVNDLALLKIQCEENKDFPYVKLGNSDDLKTGEPIFAIGNPLGFEYSISQGIISGLRNNAKEYFDDKEMTFERVIQTDAAVSPGNSGGAFFNAKGEVIGITSYQYLSLGNLNFGVAINCFKKLIEKSNTDTITTLIKSKEEKTKKVEYYLDIANSLKRELKKYDRDTTTNKLHAKPSVCPSGPESGRQTVNTDSLDNIYRNKAEYFYKKCLEIDSSYFDTYDEFIDYYTRVIQPEKAEEIYADAKKIFKNDSRLEYLTKSLETYYIDHKNFEKIKKLYGIVNNDKEVRPDVYYKLGLIYENAGNIKTAVKQYRLAVISDPKFYKASFQLGKFYYNQKKYRKAKKYLESAYKNKTMSDYTYGDDRRRFSEDTYSDFDLYYYTGMIAIREKNKFEALTNYLQLVPSTQEESEKAYKLYKKIVR